jgi:hypothetical protein
MIERRVNTFSSANHYNENQRQWSRHRRGRSVTWCRVRVPCLTCRTVRALGPNGPRVRRGGRVHQRRLDLTPGRDPIGEERS